MPKYMLLSSITKKNKFFSKRAFPLPHRLNVISGHTHFQGDREDQMKDQCKPGDVRVTPLSEPETHSFCLAGARRGFASLQGCAPPAQGTALTPSPAVSGSPSSLSGARVHPHHHALGVCSSSRSRLNLPVLCHAESQAPFLLPLYD